MNRRAAWQIEQAEHCPCGGSDEYCPCQRVQFRNPGEQRGHHNLQKVREWFFTHLCGTQAECAEDLGLSVMAVSRHVKTIRAEWRAESNQTGASK